MSRLPETGPSLRRHIRYMERQANRAADASPYTRSGTSVTAENEVTVDGALIVNGPLTATQTADITGTTHIGGATDIDGTLNVDAATTIGGNTTIGGTLGVTGITTLGAPTTVSGALNVSGPMAVTGTLSLPAGIIDNAALASPVAVDTAQAYLINYAIGTVSTVRATVSFTVPNGFSQALVTSSARAMGYNVTGGADYLYVQSVINGTVGGELYSVAPNGYGVGLSTSEYRRVIGLTGGDIITVSVATRTGFSTWAAQASHHAGIDAQVVYLR